MLTIISRNGRTKEKTGKVCSGHGLRILAAPPERPLPIGTCAALFRPENRQISVDFLAGLPPSNGFDAICAVNRQSKPRPLIPCATTITAEALVETVCDRIYRYRGLPAIAPDRGPEFSSQFWKHICTCLQIDPRLSLAFQPQVDGQTERVYAVVEYHLRAYVHYLQDSWVDYLFLAELTGNNQISDTTTLRPSSLTSVTIRSSSPTSAWIRITPY